MQHVPTMRQRQSETKTKVKPTVGCSLIEIQGELGWLFILYVTQTLHTARISSIK